MARRGRPITAPVKKLVALTEEIVDGVDRWRRQQEPAPNQSEAIRMILTEYLDANGYLRSPEAS